LVLLFRNASYAMTLNLRFCSGVGHGPACILKGLSSEREKISFHQLNKNTGHRIKYRKVDSDTGDEVEASDIIKGYEVGKGQLGTFLAILLLLRASEGWSSMVPQYATMMRVLTLRPFAAVNGEAR
jgi:hypothetical protein